MSHSDSIRRFFVLILAVLSLVGTTVYAEEGHTLGTLKGTGIDMKAYDHAIAGQIKDFVAWGAMDEANGTSELIMRKDGQTIKTTFRKENGKLGGIVRHETEGREITTSLYLVRVNKPENKIIFKVNDQEIAISITADKFENNHFINPTYRGVVAGQEFSYSLEGQACFGFSTQLSLMVLGAYLH